MGPPYRLLTGKGTVTTAGTPVVLNGVAGSRIAKRVWIQADTGDSSGYIMIGDAAVLGTSGSQQGLSGMKTSNTSNSRPAEIEGPIDLSTIYVDALTSGDKFCWCALIAD